MHSKDSSSSLTATFNKTRDETNHDDTDSIHSYKNDESIYEDIIGNITSAYDDFINQSNGDGDVLTVRKTSNVDNLYEVFMLKKSSKVTFSFFINRLLEHGGSSMTTLLYSFILLERFLELNPNIQFNKRSAILLIMSAFITSVKMQEDYVYEDEAYSKLGGISCSKLNTIETHFLELLDYKTFVSQEEFKKFVSRNHFSPNI
jgi:hypothetical protein